MKPLRIDLDPFEVEQALIVRRRWNNRKTGRRRIPRDPSALLGEEVLAVIERAAESSDEVFMAIGMAGVAVLMRVTFGKDEPMPGEAWEAGSILCHLAHAILRIEESR